MDFVSQIECYACKEGSPISNIFDGVTCPEGWTLNENPCINNNTSPGSYDIVESEKFNLSKISYKYKDVMNLLGDSMNFSEFKTKPPTTNNFFKLYNENFYELPKSTHNELITRSEDYIGKLINTKSSEIEELKKELERIQIEIDSQDREHPYFINGSILMHKDYNKDHTSGFGGISSDGTIRGPKYYMQSGKKRRIRDDYGLYAKIKKRFGMKDLKDSDIIIFLWPGGLNAIPEGPPIRRVQDLFISSYEVNMYRP